MKESRIIATIGMYSCLIMANQSTETHFTLILLAFAFFWLFRYIYLRNK